MIRGSHLGASLAAALALAACDKAAPAADPAKEAAAVNAQIDKFNAAMKAGDVEKAISVEAKDFHGYFTGAPDATTSSEDLANNKAAMHDPNYRFAVKAEHTEVAKAGDLAMQYGTWTASATDPKTGKAITSSGHWVGTWRKNPDDGSWRLAAMSGAEAPAKTSPPG